MVAITQILGTTYRYSGGPPALNLVTHSAEGGSLEFATSTTYVSYPTSADWSLGMGDYTIEWWQWLTTAAQYPRPFSVGSFPAAKIAVSIEGGTFYVWSMSSVVLSVNLLDYQDQWVHFAISREMGALRVFQNGVQISQTTNTTDIQADGETLTIGNESNVNDAGGFTGWLTNFRWTKGEALYNQNFTVSAQVLTAGANTKLLLLASTLATDVTDSTTNHVAAATNVTWKRVGPYAQRAWLDAGDITSYPGSGTAWTDLTAFGNSVTLSNTTFGLLQGGYIDFGLTGNGVFDTNPALITENLTPSASMTMWANIQQNTGFNFVAGLRSSVDTAFWFLMLDDSSQTEARVVTSAGVFDINYNFSNHYATWCHICFTVNDNVSQLFINGVQVGSRNVSGTWGTFDGDLRLASEAGGGNQSENLRMAVFRFHSRARTAAEIAAEFNTERARYGV